MFSPNLQVLLLLVIITCCLTKCVTSYTSSNPQQTSNTFNLPQEVEAQSSPNIVPKSLPIIEARANYDKPLQSSSVPAIESQLVECSNDSVRQDFGTACLKKAIDKAAVAPTTGQNTKPAQNSVPQKRIPGRISSNRHFSVKPMIVQVQKANSFGIKSPALNARELYASKGYSFPSKSVKTVSGTSLRIYPVSPANSFYNTKGSYNPVNPTVVQEIPAATAPGFSKDEDEWGQVNRETVISIPATEDLVGSRIPVETEQPAMEQNPQQQTGSGSSGVIPTGPQPYGEELEMLQSLKRSLGILCAQAMNLKQRSVLLYREARKRKLYFFDALLSKTHSYITSKQEETRNAIADIDQSIEQINHHHAVAALRNLRRTFYYYDQSAGRSFETRRAPISKRQSLNPVDPKELDRLIMDALTHAKKMREIVAELNEALDEFEEQFNLPRFEPNSIDDNALESTKEDF